MKVKWLPVVLGEQTEKTNYFNSIITERDVEQVGDGQNSRWSKWMDIR